MEGNEPHAVVRLLVKRMESHPEEFKRSLDSRWYDAISNITEFGNETDKAAINAKLRDIRLGEAHEDMMDELLNGPERRRKEEEEREYERQLIMQQARNTTQQAYAQQQSVLEAYAKQQQGMLSGIQTTGAFTPGLRGKSLAQELYDDYANTTRTSITNTTGAKGLLTDTITQLGQMIRNKK